ncbi:cold shock CspA family protein [Thermosporothrix hazakensis]|jgi:tetratricopeptide (TPR) repeat protein|uniref:Cold shock CspA family protein n=2 Tax=Thermosporothrix TaxID=768650 RepID=A0A326U818_THEHA|nr:hypothetical protein [Thermosporothrix hazakensis]PZW31886.1 cold shock CspA family protein [Thermosporothrix hazakensis]BBH91645.1 hypothetical protein KTC_63960 [Thermosporothrix sp. COM3]GCE49789.1 hypothetical protein KTH_46580 [Thermosporothrix hazakensis]
MYEDMQNSGNDVKQQAWELEKQGQFETAAELYRKALAARPDDAFSHSRYLKCLRSLKRSKEGIEWGWMLRPEVREDKYVFSMWAWCIYDVYFKKTEEREEELEGWEEETSMTDERFRKMRSAAMYVLERTEDALIRKLLVLGICREAKQRGKWDIIYKFAGMIDPSTLEKDARQAGRMSECERWYFYAIKAAFLMEQYEECQRLAGEGMKLYTHNRFFPWWHALAKARSGIQEEALQDLLTLDGRYKEWYIRADIARIYEQLGRDDDAWLWYCRAALQANEIKLCYRLIGQEMASLLQRLERFQEAYEHMQFARLIAEKENWSQSKSAEQLRERIVQLCELYAEQITPEDYPLESFGRLRGKLRRLWESAAPREIGVIRTLNQEKGFGFLAVEDESIYFRIPRQVPSLEVGMKLEFTREVSFDRKKQQNSLVAVNLRIVR